MKTDGGTDAEKRRAGEAAADRLEDGMVVGLGTGSTAAFAIRAIGRAIDAGTDVRGVPTSFDSRELALQSGIPIADLDEVDRIDVAIDGADQLVVETGACIKGGGAAHAREKVVASVADRFLVVVDPTKVTPRLDRAVPIEVLPMARSTVAAALAERGGDPTLRRAERKDGPVVTDNGNLVLDCSFGPIDDPAALGAELSAIPGVVEHGIVTDLADELVVGTPNGVDRHVLDRDR
ncbi:MAG: ribose-5-phosphate isomerase RpiA [Halobacteriota archaeon]